MPNIVLVGFMGVGKSTIAARLAKMLKMKVVEMDKLIEKRQEMSISDIFERNGEDYFRDLETELLRELAGETGIIVSTGGGVVLRRENRDLMRQTGIVVLLHANVHTIYRRVTMNDRRPLASRQSKAQIGALMKKRELFYELSADLKVSINRKTVPMICQEIIRKIEEMEEKNV